MMKNIVQKFLAFLAKRIIKKYQPKVVAITGSVGKTSTKEAVALALSPLGSVMAAKKNFNNEMGLPLAIVGFEDYPGKNIFSWLDIFIRAFGLLIYYHELYPKVLILEYGADKPGDLVKLCSIARPDVSILTAIGSAHIEFFKTEENIYKEKSTLFEKLKKNGVAIANIDNALSTKALLEAKVEKKISYGLSSDASIKFIPFDNEDILINGLSGKISILGSMVPVNFPHLYGHHQVLSALGGLSAALALDADQLSALEQIQNLNLPAGRGRKLAGIKNSTLIDDSYNSSPDAVLAGFSMLSSLRGSRPLVLVLGEMLELGSESISAHERVGLEVAILEPDLLCVVGEQAVYLELGAKNAGFSINKILHFKNSLEAISEIKNRLPKEALVYLKGSQGARIEKITKALLADPERDSQLLCRQNNEWLKK